MLVYTHTLSEMSNSEKGDVPSTQQQQVTTRAGARAGMTASLDTPAAPPAAARTVPGDDAPVLEILRQMSEENRRHRAETAEQHAATMKQQQLQHADTMKAIRSMEEKMADVLMRMQSAEARLDTLEEAEKERSDHPPALAAEVEKLSAKLVEHEDRDRRVNLRIVGFPEQCEGGDAMSFMSKALPEILELDFPGGLDLERAHRTLAPHRPGAPPRAFVVRFLRFQQRERVRNAAREKGDVRWRNHKISVYQDFSKATQDRRHAFLECKRLLHSAKIPFGIAYPAVLNFTAPSGARQRFDDSKRALRFIKEL